MRVIVTIALLTLCMLGLKFENFSVHMSVFRVCVSYELWVNIPIAFLVRWISPTLPVLPMLFRGGGGGGCVGSSN